MTDLLYPGKDPMILFIKFELFKKKLLVYLQKSNYKGIDKLVVNEILDPSVPGKFITKLICNMHTRYDNKITRLSKYNLNY